MSAVACLASSGRANIDPNPGAQAFPPNVQNPLLNLTPDERAQYQQKLADLAHPDAAQKYLDTRNYVFLCNQIDSHPSLAVLLPAYPDDFTLTYVTQTEKETVIRSLKASAYALLGPVSA